MHLSEDDNKIGRNMQDAYSVSSNNINNQLDVTITVY